MRPTLLSLEEAAQQAGVAASTLARWTTKGVRGARLPVAWQQGRMLFEPTDVAAFVARRQQAICGPPNGPGADAQDAAEADAAAQELAAIQPTLETPAPGRVEAPSPPAPAASPAGPQVEVCQVTPALAQAWLAAPRRLPLVSPRLVEQYARDMAAGRWVFNGDAIRLSVSGALLDGQHRLLAVVKSGVTIPALLVRDLPDAVVHTIDTGRPRRLSDVLRLQGCQSTVILGAALGFLQRLLPGTDDIRLEGGPKWSRDEALALLAQHPGLPASVRGVLQTVCPSPALLAALHYLFSQRDPAAADTFLAALRTGEGLVEGDPRLLLRDRFLTYDLPPRRTRTFVAAITIKAWNAWRQGGSLQVLRWGGERQRERFPPIRG